ncbi:MAG: hypothetical protein GF409_07885 [Candidatus Omnitrophica bacterium]|nr:hypothetical protein [Candidatus Omnitrophota bacterium]
MGMISVLHTAFRLFLACILGGIIGWEREKKGRSAGLRTHMLVCMGSALVMLVSMYIQRNFIDIKSIDTLRIAAGVVAGVGFLGAGAIIKSAENTRGLTTAASIWISSGIGLATGCGYFAGALIATAFSFIILFILKKFE